jgi:ArsR family transcriptional regulator
MSMQRCVPSTNIFRADFTDAVAILKATADPARLAILGTLARAAHEICVCDFTAGLSLDQSTVSHHLKILRDSGLVTWERRGTWVYYALARDARQRLQLVIDLALPEKRAGRKNVA